ncbi:MAG: general stress protein [Microbacterium sp.]|uniref:general stress protein n=1 Tax=Microbacterium sp. TaxID=51671 RepID=UPI003A866DCD
MSMRGGFPRGGTDAVGEAVARYPDYEAAQKAVSRLIAAEVPARDIAIVGTGLRSVERVTGRLGYATAARSGAINGLLLGLLFSVFLVIGSPSVPIQAFIGVMFVGIALGMLMSIITYSFVRRRRDFASAMQVVADHYDVTVAAATVHKARQVLGVAGPSAPAPAADVPQHPEATAPGPTAPAPPEPQNHQEEPPRYGQRIAPSPPESTAAASDEPADDTTQADDPRP